MPTAAKPAAQRRSVIVSCDHCDLAVSLEVPVETDCLAVWDLAVKHHDLMHKACSATSGRGLRFGAGRWERIPE